MGTKERRSQPTMLQLPTIQGLIRLDGIRLETEGWQVQPLAIEHLKSSFFENESAFPRDTTAFDHALIMRNHAHKWHQEPEIHMARE